MVSQYSTAATISVFKNGAVSWQMNGRWQVRVGKVQLHFSYLEGSEHSTDQVAGSRFQPFEEVHCNGRPDCEFGPKSYSNADLMRFTSNFSNKIGSGGYGEVYKGHIQDNVTVAVKVLENKDVVRETFVAEVSTISKASHRYIVKLHGYCFEPNMKALVYEYMENGSLDKILYQNPHSNIEWGKLYGIAIQIGKGLDYLHNGWDEQIIHYDIKAGNVLLDSKFSSKIADFGLAKLMKRDESRVPLTRTRGTVGYNAPETWMPGSYVTFKCDVFSFGMLLFEILGKRSNGMEENWFPQQVWEQFKNGKLEVIFRDCGILDKDKEKANILSKVAFWCAQDSPELRPSMTDVVLMLEEKISVGKPPSPPFGCLQLSSCSMVPLLKVIPDVCSEVPPSRNESLFEKKCVGREEDKNNQQLCKKVGGDASLVFGECSSKSVMERTTLLNKASQLSNENQISQVPDIGRELHERLRREKAAMIAKADDVKARLFRAETEEGKVATNSVKNWLHYVEDVGKKISTANSQSDLGQNISGLITEVTELTEKGDQFSGESLALLPPQRGLKLPVTSLVGETTALNYSKNVWDWLMNDQTRVIGMYGMGGVGKTTIAMNIYNRLLEEQNCFGQVIWVTVSKDASVGKLQKDMAKAVNVNLSLEQDELEDSKLLLRALEQRKNVAIIMDDMWENISLYAIGIPKPSKENGYKLVVTTRSLEVCKQMRCHQDNIVRVEPLTKEEAWELFVDKVNVEFLPEVRTIAVEVVKECAGLPLAIITIGGAMTGNNDLSEWRLALSNLRDSSEQNMDRENKVYKCLKFSYDWLPNEQFRKCFLYCALYPEDWYIETSELVGFWILDGLIEGSNRQHELDQGQLILNKLTNHCLLESDTRFNVGNCARMHDLIRDMALSITSKCFMVKAGALLTSLPNEIKWGEDLERASFMENDIKEISISLRVLDLRYNHHIKWLPDSISDLVNLRALFFNRCQNLKRVPSLAKLVQLRTLELDDTDITELPEGIEMLVNLRCLSLTRISLRKTIPMGLISKLSKLQELYLDEMETDKLYVVGSGTSFGEELLSLKELEYLNISFHCFSDYSSYVGSPKFNGLKRFTLIVGGGVPEFYFEEPFDLNKIIISIGIDSTEIDISIVENTEVLEVVGFKGPNIGVFSCLKYLYICKCNNLKNVFSSSGLLQLLQNLQQIVVADCDELEELIEGGDNKNTETPITLPKLWRLKLENLPKLKSIWRGVLICDSLDSVSVQNCSELKRLPQFKGKEQSILSPASLIEIIGSTEWWDSLEWDPAYPQNILQPFLIELQEHMEGRDDL
ncbi:hypothetical protein AQUCO_10100006v1 [Aquilegia coerulea]|uniref:non-specific serine/threonine protein kinase n=1 Tax=Aquilegia coerulea TaxID=218851 RepID=A0A2G5C411_AQUCA|nr:hypothetical protein AQUCO_10100006v1 [Aquilegia coerulea]